MPPPTDVWAIDERDVRRLCGEAILKQADALQRAGHVVDPVVDGATLRSPVRGTWRRVDQVSVSAQGTKLMPTCTCGARGVCRHAGALLLQWVRVPASFAEVGAEDDDGDDDLDDAGLLGAIDSVTGGGGGAPGSPGTPADQPDTAPAPESPVEELARAFEQDSAPHLRVIARQRQVPSGTKTKADLVTALSTALAAPESVDAALAALDPDAQRALDAAYLLGAIYQLTKEVVANGYRALGGAARAAPVDTLIDRGLLVAYPRAPSGPATWKVPRAVATRLPVRSDLVEAAADSNQQTAGPGTGGGGAEQQPLQSRSGTYLGQLAKVRRLWPGSGAASRATAAVAPATGLSFGELLVVTAYELGQREVHWPPLAAEAQPLAPFVPAGWQVDTASGRPAIDPTTAMYRQQDVRILPTPLLTPDALRRLVRRTGQPAIAAAFAVHVLVALGIVEGDDRLVVHTDRLQRLLELPAEARLALLATTWLATLDWAVSTIVAGDGGPLQLRYQIMWYAGLPGTLPGIEALRNLVARLVAQLAPGRWYRFDSLLDLLWRLAPQVLGADPSAALRAGPGGAGYRSWWFAVGGGKGQPVDLTSRRDWQRVCGPIVAAVLSGPLSWLGFVEVAGTGPGGRSAGGAGAADLAVAPSQFQVRPTAGILAGRSVPAEMIQRPAALAIGGDLTVVVPAGTTEMATHGLLARAGELIDADASGVRFRLTAAGVQSVLDDGAPGPALLQYLADRAGTVPKPVVETIERWADGYGSARLYDELTLLELGDDLLLQELLATTGLRSRLIHTFSPRLIAVDSNAVDELLAELVRLGHAPRVVEGA